MTTQVSHGKPHMRMAPLVISFESLPAATASSARMRRERSWETAMTIHTKIATAPVEFTRNEKTYSGVV